MTTQIRIFPRDPQAHLNDSGGKPFAVVDLDHATAVHVSSREIAKACAKAFAMAAALLPKDDGTGATS